MNMNPSKPVKILLAGAALAALVAGSGNVIVHNPSGPVAAAQAGIQELVAKCETKARKETQAIKDAAQARKDAQTRSGEPDPFANLRSLDAPALDAPAPIVCDPTVLQRTMAPLLNPNERLFYSPVEKQDLGIQIILAQYDLIDAQIALDNAQKREASERMPWLVGSYVAAIAIVAFSAVPWLWYFLLRRLVELRQAVIGR